MIVLNAFDEGIDQTVKFDEIIGTAWAVHSHVQCRRHGGLHLFWKILMILNKQIR